MEKFIIWNYTSEPEHTLFEYEVGEIITVNSLDVYKCMEKKSRWKTLSLF